MLHHKQPAAARAEAAQALLAGAARAKAEAGGSPCVPLPASLQEVALVDVAQVLSTFGLRAPSVIYEWVAAGTMPPPIRLSARCSRWLTAEVRALAAARAAGQTDGELRHLVEELCTRRKALASGASAAATMPAANGAQP